MLDFSAALPQNDFDASSGPIPNGTLAWVMVNVRWFNQDQGIVETTSKHTGSQYLDCELTVVGGRHDKRKIFTKIGIYSPKGETYTNMGRSAMKAILEVGVGAGAQNPNGYRINNYGDLSGLKAAVRIKIEPGKDGYADKNDVSLWLTPNADTPSAAAEFARLVAGDTEPKAGTPVTPVARAAKPAAPAAPAWGAPTAGANHAITGEILPPARQAAPAAPAAPGKPSWL